MIVSVRSKGAYGRARTKSMLAAVVAIAVIVDVVVVVVIFN